VNEIETSRDIEDVKMLVDAQTSGGLLVAIAPEQVGLYLGAVEGSVVIGELTSENSLQVV